MSAYGLPGAAAPFVLVSGGKGGVGKTTIAVNLALALARAGRRTLLVDFDLGLANVDVLLRLPAARTLADALAGECALEDCLVELPCGLAVLPASSGLAELARLDAGRHAELVARIGELARAFECVIGDCPAGIGPDVLALSAIADLLLLVTTPEPAALTDAYGLIKALDARSHAADEIATPEIVINQCDGVDQAELVARKLRGVCERFLARSPRLAGWLAASRAVRESCATQRPFVLAVQDARNSLEAACLRRLAARVERLCPAREGGALALKGS